MSTRSLFTGLCTLAVVLTMVGCGPKTIHQSVKNNKYNQVKKFLDDDPELVNALDPKTRWTALHYAADGGYKKIVDLLLERGADPLAKDPAGWTPLDAAMKRGNLKVEKDLEQAILDSGGQLP